MKPLNVLIVGVGGQGNLLASRILGEVAMRLGYDVKVSEVHGMSQRGGSVITYVKMAQKVHSPLIDKQEADFILAFEQLEALRYTDYLKKDGVLIVNTQKIIPMTVASGSEKYPEGILDALQAGFENVEALDALSIATACGNARSVNMVMLGAMARHTEIPEDTYIEAMTAVVPPKFLEVNTKAFQKAMETVS